MFSMMLFALLAVRGRAIIFTSTGDPSYNTNAPTGSLTNSGWQYEGQWYVWLGTPIAPRFFLAAHHINGNVGDVFVYNGFSYHTVNVFDDPNTDLRIWQVAETFPSYAPLYTKSDEAGKLCVIIGRGTDRGPAVLVNSTTVGWEWGNTNNIQRWGENIVSDVYTNGPNDLLLRGYFDRNGVTNECGMTYNDSSGAMFIEDGTTWKLAAINYAVDGPEFSHDGSGNSTFDGALMDLRGLYYWNGAAWTLYAPTNYPVALPTGFYCTRVSSRISWINSIINFNPGPDLQVTNVEMVGASAHIDLSTGSNRLYRVDYNTDLVTGVWTTVTNNVAGTGGIVTITDLGAGGKPKRFYRVTIVQ
jgi:hypothetical protein